MMIPNRSIRAHLLLVAPCTTLFFFLLLFAAGCSRQSAGEDARTEQSITVAAASNLTDAFAEVGKRFTERTGVRVAFSFGGTVDLAKQIENGAPFDIFASADVASIDRLAAKGLIVPETRRLFARGLLVLWTRRDGRVAINKVEELERPEITLIAIAKPEIAPYGRAAVEALKELKLWDRMAAKVVYANNVAQAKQFASSGNADAAFIPLSLVKSGEGSHIEIESRLHSPLNQAIGVIEASGQKEIARRFVDFILSDEGQAVMEGFGYRKPAANE